MKKLVTAACALAAAMALADGVESANTVGYTTVNLTAGKWYMIGIQFQDIGGGAIKLDDLIKLSGVTASTWEDQETKAIEIQYWNGGNYDHLYYISDAYAYGTETELGKDCWALDGVESSDFAKTPGEGFWLHATTAAIGQNATLTVKGEVKDAESATVSFTANRWKIISNPFPVAIDLNDVVTSGVTASTWDNQETDAAEIQYWNGSNYDHFYYISDAYAAGTETELGTNCWALDGVQTEGDSISVGGSFWLLSKQSGSLTFAL